MLAVPGADVPRTFTPRGLAAVPQVCVGHRATSDDARYSRTKLIGTLNHMASATPLRLPGM
jgi:hypothetical protein